MQWWFLWSQRWMIPFSRGIASLPRNRLQDRLQWTWQVALLWTSPFLSPWKGMDSQLNRRRIGVPCAGTLTRVSGLEHHADLDPQGWDQSNVPYNPKPLAILIRAHVSGTALNLLAIHICCVMMNPNSSHLEPDGMIKLLASIIH